MKHRIQLVLSIGWLLFLIVGSVKAQESRKVEEKTFRISTDGNITLIADEGDLTVRAWEKDEVHLKIIKRARGRDKRETERLLEEKEILIQEGPDRLLIRELDGRDERGRFNFFDIFDGDFWTERHWRSVIVDFELTVPRGVRLKLQCDEGDVQVTGTEGKLTVSMDEGDVLLEDVRSGDVQVNIDEGDIRVFNLQSSERGFCKLTSDEGHIVLEDCDLDEADLGTDEGDIILRNVRVYRFWLSTDEGDIETDFQPVRDGNYRMQADEGDLEIRLPGNADLRVRLQTDEGRVDSDYDLSRQRRDDGELREGTIGSGEGMLKAYTEEGDIYIIERR